MSKSAIVVVFDEPYFGPIGWFLSTCVMLSQERTIFSLHFSQRDLGDKMGETSSGWSLKKWKKRRQKMVKLCTV